MSVYHFEHPPFDNGSVLWIPAHTHTYVRTTYFAAHKAHLTIDEVFLACAVLRQCAICQWGKLRKVRIHSFYWNTEKSEDLPHSTQDDVWLELRSNCPLQTGASAGRSVRAARPVSLLHITCPIPSQYDWGGGERRWENYTSFESPLKGGSLHIKLELYSSDRYISVISQCNPLLSSPRHRWFGSVSCQREDIWAHPVSTMGMRLCQWSLSSHAFLRARPWRGPGHPPPPWAAGLQRLTHWDGSS